MCMPVNLLGKPSSHSRHFFFVLFLSRSSSGLSISLSSFVSTSLVAVPTADLGHSALAETSDVSQAEAVILGGTDPEFVVVDLDVVTEGLCDCCGSLGNGVAVWERRMLTADCILLDLCLDNLELKVKGMVTVMAEVPPPAPPPPILFLLLASRAWGELKNTCFAVAMVVLVEALRFDLTGCFH